MKAELFSVKYADKDAAAMVYKKITEVAEELDIIAYGLERFKTKSRRSRSNFKLHLVVAGEAASMSQAAPFPGACGYEERWRGHATHRAGER